MSKVFDIAKKIYGHEYRIENVATHSRDFSHELVAQ